MIGANCANAAEFYVAPGGSDDNTGTKEKPFVTLARAQKAARIAKGAGPVTVYLREGTYYLPEPLVFTPEDSGAEGAPVAYRVFEGETPVISGGVRLKLDWQPYKDGIVQAKVPAGLETDQLFVNGAAQPMARYPNYDPRVAIFHGYAADAFSRERAARWADPAGGFIHALHSHMWGGFHYRITGKNPDGSVAFEGGWQNNRRMGMHGTYRFVENIFEELDSPGEWFLNTNTGTLYFYPPKGLDLRAATVEAVRLRHLVEFRGSAESPVRFVALAGLTFRHAARTFMETREPLNRSDWTIYRGGAVLLTGCEDCTVADCEFDQVGGNAVFVSNYNRRVAVRGCHIHGAGASGVCFVGDPAAVRWAGQKGAPLTAETVDRHAGPKGENYPADCLVEDCLIHDIGRTEKQPAGVQISMSRRITVRHCSIYDVPRAGINVSEGAWGGHVIEFCDVFDTVKETGDHGSFNSWGRDRYWHLKGLDLDTVALGENKDLPLLDAVETTVIRNSRWRCDRGWDIDLDDGSSNYHIYNNLCLAGGIKLREGFHRVCENNVIVNNSLNPHVWFRNSQDVVRRNIVFSRYLPIRVPQPWGRQCDCNLLHTPGLKESRPAAGLRRQSGLDEHSVEADARFIDPAKGDYRVADGSPALELGFKNFDMTKFGVRKRELKAIALTPALPGLAKAAKAPEKDDTITWLGAKIKSMQTEGEKSATGMYDITGVLFIDVPSGSEAEKLGFGTLDVVLAVDGRQAANLKDFLDALAEAEPGAKLAATARRGGKQRLVMVPAGR